MAAVAVGDDAKATRQITGVAAGTYSTDGVNVAQLYQTYKQTQDAGLNFGANMGGVKNVDLTKTLNIAGGMSDTSADTASAENLRTVITQDTAGGDAKIEIQMTKTPTFITVKATKTITVGDNTDPTKNIVINQDGDTNIISGLTNKDAEVSYDYTGGTVNDITNNHGDTLKDSSRAATESQLYQAYTDLAEKGSNYSGNFHTGATNTSDYVTSGGGEAESIHRNQGQLLKLEGGDAYQATDAKTGREYSGRNLRTQTDGDTGTVQLLMDEKPEFEELKARTKVVVGNEKNDGDNIVIRQDNSTGDTINTITGLSNTGAKVEYAYEGGTVTDIKNDQGESLKNSNRAASEDQVYRAYTDLAEKGMNFSGNDHTGAENASDFATNGDGTPKSVHMNMGRLLVGTLKNSFFCF